MISRRLPWLLFGVLLVGRAYGAESTPAGPVAPSETTIGKAMADHFTDALRKNQYEFLPEDKLASLHAEIEEFASRYAAAQLPLRDRQALLTAIDWYVPRHFPGTAGVRGQSGPESAAERTYLAFRDLVNTFKWRLWQGLARKPLTAEQTQPLRVQHEWLRQFIGRIPARQGDAYPPGIDVGSARAWATARLEEMFVDPLGLLADPMPTRQFELFRNLMERSSGNGLVAAISDVPVRALGARAHTSAGVGTAYQYPFDIELPFKDEVRAIYSGMDAQLAFASNTKFRGMEVTLDAQNKSLFDISSGVCAIPILPSSKNLRSWWESHFKIGDFGYDDAKVRVLTVRDAQIARLKVSNWFEADRVSETELRKLISKDGKSTMSLKDVPSRSGPAAITARFFVVVQSQEGRLAVIEFRNRDPGELSILSRIRPAR